LCIIFS
jgi:DNA-directed RNA polymerase II subunit RPB3